jgi:LDH2 family malate/lactate/ureidoglycolate dehydrogenase
MKLAVEEVEAKVRQLLADRGFDAASVDVICKPIMWAVTHGNNQGLLKLVGEPALQQDTTKREISIVKEGTATAVIDGGDRNAMIALDFAIKKAIVMAEAAGVAVVGLRGTHSSSGVLAYYAELVSQQGFVGIVLARTPPTVAPFDVLEPFVGTNPLAYSFPTESEPLTFDMATAAIAWYGILQAATDGTPLPEGLITDVTGQPTTDPNVAMENGLVLPFGKHKGAGLGMMVELLAGSFIGAASMTAEGEWGHLVLVLDPAMFGGRGEFRAATSRAIATLRAAKTRDGKPVRLPGDRAKRFYADTQTTGRIEVPETVLQKLGWL